MRDNGMHVVPMHQHFRLTLLCVARTCRFTHYTGSALFDACGSIVIGGLMGTAALFLIEKNRRLLLGTSVPKKKRISMIKVGSHPQFPDFLSLTIHHCGPAPVPRGRPDHLGSARRQGRDLQPRQHAIQGTLEEPPRRVKVVAQQHNEQRMVWLT
jgi:hypothetical protein